MTSITEHTQRDPAADQAIYEAAVSQVLDEAKAQGATSSEAGISCESGFSTTVRLGDVETVEHHRDRGMGVTVYFGQRKGSASTSDLSAGALRDAVRAACDIAKYTSEDECAGLADADCMATEIPD
ncbi:MAG TPA: metalloprotease PmbA, partial [Chromatiales bacterium]|nr:metalloprotease PmbA [Chromatiales bacterium]